MSGFNQKKKSADAFNSALKKLVGVVPSDAIFDFTSAGNILRDYSLFHEYGFLAGMDAAITAILDGEIDLEEALKARAAYEAKD